MKAYKLITTAVLAIISSASLFAQKMEPDRTVKFADRDTCALYMDIYDPQPSKVVCDDGKVRPTVIHVFGGGFMEGSRHQEWLRPWFRHASSLVFLLEIIIVFVAMTMTFLNMSLTIYITYP